jgi:hypothetical protein
MEPAETRALAELYSTTLTVPSGRRSTAGA